MSNVLVIAELRGNEPKKVTLELIGAATKMAQAAGGAVSTIAIGESVLGLGAKLGPYGTAKVYLAGGVSKYSTEGFINIIEKVVKQENPSVILLGATSTGKDLAPRLAARLNTGLASDCVSFELQGSNPIFIRPVFAGKAFNKVAFNAGPAIATIRPNVLPVPEPGGAAAAEINADASLGDVKADLAEVIQGESKRLDLTEADRIVSGGRGMKARENFNIIEELADSINASVGASRAAVDSGYADQSFQVGQTGKVVNPSLYIACGISGAIQHLAGMRTSKVIVAINKDPEAPIFTKADYGIIGDLFEAVPLMTAEFKKLLAE